MIGLLLPKGQKQNAVILSEGVSKSLFDFGLSEVLIKTGSKSECRAKANDSGVVQCAIFVQFAWVWTLQKLALGFQHFRLGKGLLYV